MYMQHKPTTYFRPHLNISDFAIQFDGVTDTSVTEQEYSTKVIDGDH